MSLTPPTVSLGSSLFGGLFGTPQPGANGLFGMLINLFGQSLGGGQTSGQSLLPTQLLQPGLLTTEGAILAGDAATALPTDSAGLLTLLQNMAQNPPASPELQTLLGDTSSLDLAALQARFAALDEDRQQALLGEIAALLMPPPVQTTAATPDLCMEGDGCDAAPLLEEAPAVTLFDPDAAGHAEALLQQGDTQERALAALTSALQNGADQQQRADTSAHLNTEALKTEAQVRAARHAELMTPPPDTEGESAPVLSAASSELSPVTPQPRRATSTSDQPQNVVASTSDPKSITAPAVHPDSARPVTPASATTPSGPVKSELQSLSATTGGETGSPALTLPTSEARRDAQGASFTDHLSKVNLSRTGAHIPVSEQVAVQMTKAMKDGHDRMTIRLQPAELGRIEIRLDMSADGRVTASFSVDQPATLDLLQRDRGGLERALSDAGLKADSSTLSFNLRDNGSGGRGPANDNPQQNSGNTAPGLLPEDGLADEALPAGMIEMVWHVSPDRVDVRI